MAKVQYYKPQANNNKKKATTIIKKQLAMCLPAWDNDKCNAIKIEMALLPTGKFVIKFYNMAGADIRRC